MNKKRIVGNRKLSMLLVLAMLMTMFVGVGTASAAAYFKVLRAPTVQTSADPQNLGSVSIKLEDVEALPPAGAWLTIVLSDGCTFKYEYEWGNEVETSDNIWIEEIVKTAADTMEILVKKGDCTGDDLDGEIIILFNDVIVESGSGDIVARFFSNHSVFGIHNTAVIGNISIPGATNVLSKSVANISNSGGEVDTLIIAEKNPGAFEPGEVITVSLPEGFTWGLGAEAEGIKSASSDILNNFRHVAGAWSLLTWAFRYDIDGRDFKVYLDYDIGDYGQGAPFVKTAQIGRINIGSNTGGFFKINVDDTAEFGYVYVTVSSTLNSVKTTDVMVAEYVRDCGDVNGDGSINSFDHQRLFEHLNGTNPLAGDALIAGDVNEDGIINSFDHQRLFEHLNGTNPLNQ